MGHAIRDQNYRAVMLGVNSNDATIPLPLQIDPATGRLLVTTTVSQGVQYDEDDAHTTGDTGTLIFAVRNDTLASLVDTDGDYAPLQVSAAGALYTESVPSGHATVGTGLTTVFDADGDNTAQVIKASAGRLYFLEISNPNDADAFIQLFDVAAGSVSVGTTTPKLSLFVPAGDGTKDGAMDKVFAIPVHFGTAITYACTTTATGNGDPATGLIVNAGYV